MTAMTSSVSMFTDGSDFDFAAFMDDGETRRLGGVERIVPLAPCERTRVVSGWPRTRDMEETVEQRLYRLQRRETCAVSFPVRLHAMGGHETELVSGWRLGRPFARWWATVAARPGTVGSCRNVISPTVAAKLFLAGVRADEAKRALPWTGLAPRVDGLRSFRAVQRIVWKLGRRAVASTSRSGLTKNAPTILYAASGRDLVRLSRLGREFLRWLSAVTDARGDGLFDGRRRIDWAVVAKYHAEWQEIRQVRSVFEAAKVPMRHWRSSAVTTLVTDLVRAAS